MFGLARTLALPKRQDPVNPSLDAQDEVGGFHIKAEPDLLLVAGRAGALEPLVSSCPGQRAVGPDELAFAAKVAPAQSELNKLAHLDRENWL